jgi:hypothetical protein
MMLAMTRPVRSSKVILIEDRLAAPRQEQGRPLRRYRLARLRLDARSGNAADRFEHLKRVYD